MEKDWLRLIIGQRIWAGRCQHSINSSASRLELKFYDAGITLFLDSDTSLKGRVLNEIVPKERESGWSNENYLVSKEHEREHEHEHEHEDNELIKLTFHKLWTAAAIREEKYNKGDWKRLAAVLSKAGYKL
jgi:hypothetical protein